nr:hypothetical protein Itr_chr11CG23460 [Ipomoea trifida]GME09438.1 hypothetical protein Iba_scaffold8711CG0010 [Ipomoea batatas]
MGICQTVSPATTFSFKDAEIWSRLPDLEHTDFEGLASNGLKKAAPGDQPYTGHPLHYFAVFEGHGHAHIDKNTESKMASMSMAKLIAASQKRVQLPGAAAFFNPLPARPSKSVIRQAAPNLSIFEGEGHHWTHCRHMPVKCKLKCN